MDESEPTLSAMGMPDMAAGLVCNYSEDELLIVNREDGVLVRRPLGPGRCTPAAAAPVAVISRDENPIRNHDYGWKLDDGAKAYLYNRPTFFDLFTELDLHCIPSLPAPWEQLVPSYRKAAKGEFDSHPVNDSNGWSVPAPTPGRHDGFHAVTRDNDLDPWTNPAECSYIRTTIGTGQFITVRLSFDRLPGSPLELAIVQAMDFWNSPANPIPSSGKRLLFRVEVVAASELHDQHVMIDPNVSIANTGEWSPNSHWKTIAHEFGHFLGLIDEYYLNTNQFGGYRRTPPDLQLAITAEQARFHHRHRERVQVGSCSKPENLMENTHRGNTAVNPIIDLVLIDAIDLHARQELCLRDQ